VELYALTDSGGSSTQSATVLDAQTAAAVVGPALLCDIARAAGVSVTTVNLVSVRSLNATSGIYTTISLNPDTFPNTITDADCGVLATGGTITAPTRLLFLLPSDPAHRAASHIGIERQLTGIPSLSLTTQVVVPATTTSGSVASSDTGASATDIVTSVSSVQSKIAAAIAGNTATAATSGSTVGAVNLGTLSRLNAAWLTAQDYHVTFTDTGSAVVVNAQGDTIAADAVTALLSSGVTGSSVVGGNAVVQAQERVAAQDAATPTTADATVADKRRNAAIIGGAVGGGIGFIGLIALAAWELRKRRAQAAAAAAMNPATDWTGATAAAIARSGGFEVAVIRDPLTARGPPREPDAPTAGGPQTNRIGRALQGSEEVGWGVPNHSPVAAADAVGGTVAVDTATISIELSGDSSSVQQSQMATTAPPNEAPHVLATGDFRAMAAPPSPVQSVVQVGDPDVDKAMGHLQAIGASPLRADGPAAVYLADGSAPTPTSARSAAEPGAVRAGGGLPAATDV